MLPYKNTYSHTGVITKVLKVIAAVKNLGWSQMNYPAVITNPVNNMFRKPEPK